MTDQTGTKLENGDRVAMCFGVGMIQGYVQLADDTTGALFVCIPIPADPTKPILNIVKIAAQSATKKGTAS